MADATPTTDAASIAASHIQPLTKEQKLKALQRQKVEQYAADQAQRGVCYLGTLPPYITQEKLRQLLQQHNADVDRIYLTPEDKSVTKRRAKAAGTAASTKRVKYVDGWVEFTNKKDAKRIALMLNNQPMELHKRDKYSHDLWVIKYLSGFKWAHLTDKLQHDRAVRQSKIREDMRHARDESERYLRKVDLAAYEQRKRKRGEVDDRGAAAGDSASAAPMFKQRTAIDSYKQSKTNAG